MNNINFTYGTNLYDFFILPTIRVESRYRSHRRLTLEWLNFYIGVAIWSY